MRCSPLLWVKSVLVISLIGYFFVGSSARAAIDSCSSSVSPTELTRNSQTTVTFTITNSSSEDAQYIGISSPNSYFSLIDGTSSGWNLDYQDEFEVILSGGTIPAGQNGTVTVTLNTADIEWSAEAWEVKLDSDPAGETYIICSGSPSTSIVTGQAGDSSAPVISGITISNVKDSSVTVSWTTNEGSDSEIRYSTDLTYGSVVQSSSLVTTHSLDISNLSANTTYNFRLYSSDSSGNEGQSSTDKFTAAAQGTTGSTVTIIKTVTPTPLPTPIPDRTPPTIIIDTDISKPFTKPPIVIGKARDAKGVVSVEYSLDGGKNWTIVDSDIKVGANVSFNFAPPLLDDDNYKLKVRAKDAAGNIGLSKVYTLIIDRLPPQVGAGILSIGPLILPTINGVIFGLEGMDQKITLSAVGGPINIDIISGNKIFSLVKNIDNGLWSGTLSFEESGEYKLVSKSVDGAGSEVERTLGSIVILPRGKILSANSTKVDATVDIYYFDQTTRQFVLWDGKAYGQTNPQTVKSDGSYSLFLPAGKYYLEVKAHGYRNLRTDIFEIMYSMPVNTNFKLEKKFAFFDISQTQVQVDISKIFISEKEERSPLIGKQLVDVELSDTDKTFQVSSLRGKRMLISVLNSWNPSSFQQIAILNVVEKKGAVHVAAIFPQETASKINILKLRGAYDFLMLVDQDGLLIEPLNIFHLPMNLYVSRNGTIERVDYGILSEGEIEKNLLD